MNADSDLDLLGVLVTRRGRSIEVAQVLRRHGFASIAGRSSRRAAPPTARAPSERGVQRD